MKSLLLVVVCLGLGAVAARTELVGPKVDETVAQTKSHVDLKVLETRSHLNSKVREFAKEVSEKGL